MVRRTLAVAAVLLVLVSGCLGLGAGGENTPNPDEVSGTPSPTATPTATPPATERIPTGWSETGVRDENAALQAHYRAVLTGPSATVSYRVLEGDSDQAPRTTLDVALDPDSERMYAQIGTAARSQEVYYANGTLTQYNPESDTVAGSQDAQYSVAVQSADLRVLKSQLLLYRLALNETRTVERDGTLVYDVVGVYRNTTSRTFGAVESGQGRILVTTDGRIRAINTTVTYTNATVRYRYAHENLGTTDVPEPDWLPS